MRRAISCAAMLLVLAVLPTAPTQARDVLLVLTGPQLYVQYTRELGWTPDQLAGWLTAAVLQQVFALG